VIENTQYEILRCSTAAVLASGTITLEAAIIGTPAVVTYSLPSWMFFLARHLVKVPYISLANLISGKEVYPEVVKEKGKEQIIASKLIELIRSEEKRGKIKRELKKIRDLLGTPGASWRIAEDMIKYLLFLKKKNS
jgi:lipid-A-disaccharide synthase